MEGKLSQKTAQLAAANEQLEKSRKENAALESDFEQLELTLAELTDGNLMENMRVQAKSLQNELERTNRDLLETQAENDRLNQLIRITAISMKVPSLCMAPLFSRSQRCVCAG